MLRFLAGALILIVSAALAAGAAQLWSGEAQSWPGVIASKATVRRTARGMAAMSALLLAAAIAVFAQLPRSESFATGAIVAVVLAAFWANKSLFGSMRATHTITNVVIAGIVVALLWYGHLASGR